MKKLMAAAVVGCGMLFGSVSGAEAGVFELFHDDITTGCNSAIEPCKRNDLGYQTRYVQGRYLRYGIKKTPARYTWRHERIMIAPPRIVLSKRRVWSHKIGGKRLVPVQAAGHYKVVAPAQYATVSRRVLIAPARNRVVRLAPHSAYFADTIIVKGGGCKRPLTWHSC